MARLIYSYLASLDGYVADEKGKFDWAMPDEEVHEYVNELERSIGTYLFGRRMYETMVGWETDPSIAAQSPAAAAYAEIWKGADKIVYSGTLDKIITKRTRIDRTFDPVAVTQLKKEAIKDISIGGATLAAAALKSKLVDEINLFIVPYVAGGGLRMFPERTAIKLDLLEDRRFKNGMSYFRYAVIAT